MQFITLAIALFSTTGWAGYVLQDDYFANGDFFSNFDFFDSSDPTHGFVEYQSQSDASSAGLVSSDSSNAKMMVDSTNVTPDGRPSVRITSKNKYSSGLIVLDVDHMPGGVCGTWPAFWTVGPNWPLGGEIHIIEGVNDQSQNDMTLHTGPGCSILSNTGLFSGQMRSSSCESSNGNNQGCQIASSDSNSYGAGFNSGKGGVYAMEWSGTSIAVYFFPRNSIPSDALGDSPNPSAWGKPVAYFGGGCDMLTSFIDQQIVFDTTFCGDWAGSSDVWGSSTCSQHGSCTDFVSNNPSAFKDAYWSINALKVYSSSGNSSPAPEPSPTSTYEPISTAAPDPVTTSSPAAEPTTASPSESGSGYAPWVGSDGTVNFGSPQQSQRTSAAAAPTPTSDGGSSGWTTGPDGFLNYGDQKQEDSQASSAAAPAPSSDGDSFGWTTGPDGFAHYGSEKRDEEGGLRERALKHLRMHKRHGGGRI